MHSYTEVLVSIMYCWEINQAMHCPFQILPPGKNLTPSDVVEPSDQWLHYASRHKLTRVSAFKQLESLGNQMRVMAKWTQPGLTLQSFTLPPSFNVRPTGAREGRNTKIIETDIEGRRTTRQVSYIVDLRTAVETAVLPPEAINVRLLTLQLDQGAIGGAGCAYCMFHRHMMMMCVFDKIHRLIRDVKGASNDCCKKIFVKTKMWSAYLFSLNKRPFGGGGNATLKSEWIKIFEQTCDINSDVFEKYLPKIAPSWGMPYSTVPEKQAVFNKVLEMASFNKHLSHPKLANWFAWNKSAKEQIPEFFAAKMVFESQVECELGDPDNAEAGSFEIGANTDPRKELNSILQNGGGLRLGYRLMKSSMHSHLLILSVAENACWDYYVNEVKNVKSPADHLARTFALSVTWASEPHLWSILEETLLDPVNLNYMQIDMGPSELATKTLHLAWSLFARRVWTMSKHTAPPNCYAEVVRPGAEHANKTCVGKMKTHHVNIMSLENARHENSDANEVWKACLYLHMTPVRLLLEYFKRDMWSEHSQEGVHLLMGLVSTLADNKIAEDVHAKLRLAAKHHANTKLSSQTIQDEINHSGVIEARQITHQTKVSKDFPLPQLSMD